MSELEKLEDALVECGIAHRHATNRVQEAYPAGSHVIVRTKRFGYAAKEWLGEVRGASVHVSPYGASVYVAVRNLKTGKITTRYPGCQVDGLPAVRPAD